MKIKHRDPQPEVHPHSAFKNCKLEREPYAIILTDIVKSYADGFVLALNNKWGTGKTTFVKMWQQYLINDDIQTIYFNAWENDFDSNPLAALLGELHSVAGNDVEKRGLLKKMTKNVATFSKAVAPALVKSVANRYIGSDFAKDMMEAIAKGSADIFENEVKEYNAKKEGMKEFKKLLKEFVGKNNNVSPLVFFVDELDRCRPTYAVEVLEQIKHLFSVEGIVFVLSIDKDHLASAVKGFYGSNDINTDEYLRRFIDLEYSLPDPSYEALCQYFFEYFSLGTFFNMPNRINNGENGYDGETFTKASSIMAKHANLTPRQLEKIFAQTRLILRLFEKNQYMLPRVLFYLIYIKHFNSTLFRQIEQGRLSLEELYTEYNRNVPDHIENNTRFTIVELIFLYNNNIQPHLRRGLTKKDENENWYATFTDDIGIAGSLNQLSNTMHMKDMTLNSLFDKINLTTQIFEK